MNEFRVHVERTYIVTFRGWWLFRTCTRVLTISCPVDHRKTKPFTTCTRDSIISSLPWGRRSWVFPKCEGPRRPGGKKEKSVPDFSPRETLTFFADLQISSHEKHKCFFRDRPDFFPRATQMKFWRRSGRPDLMQTQGHVGKN